MSHRPLVFVTGLTVGDYVLWEWSLSGNHEVIAVVAGLSLPLLVLVMLWRAALAVGRLLADFGTSRSAASPVRPGRRRAARRRRAGAVALGESPVPSASAETPRKIAA